MQKDIKKQLPKKQNESGGQKNTKDEKGNGNADNKNINNSKKVSHHPTTEPNPGG